MPGRTRGSGLPSRASSKPQTENFGADTSLITGFHVIRHATTNFTMFLFCWKFTFPKIYSDVFISNNVMSHWYKYSLLFSYEKSFIKVKKKENFQTVLFYM